jgi:hypothetical protein
MATSSDIKWGSYRDFEGPFYHGIARFQLPEQPTATDRILAVITATEGGRWDAYNGYDRCICTSGLIQWCEAGQYSVTDMMGKVAEHDRALLESVDRQAAASGLELKRNQRGRWRFFFQDERGEVDRIDEQRQMFLLHSDGKRGSWDDASREYAKRWAAAISTVWESDAAQRIQADYTTRRLSFFALPNARRILDEAPDTGVGQAFKAAYLSFAANNPTYADRHLKLAVDASSKPRWSLDWLIGVLKELTFGPGVAIYPHRYDAIRPVLERLYAVNLPDLAAELSRFSDAMGGGPVVTVVEAQKLLIELGFDLGPWGADGKFGKKTREALISFQQLHGLPAHGDLDAPTQKAMHAQRDAAESVTAELRRRVEAQVTLSMARLAREAVAAGKPGGDPIA